MKKAEKDSEEVVGLDFFEQKEDLSKVTYLRKINLSPDERQGKYTKFWHLYFMPRYLFSRDILNTIYSEIFEHYIVLERNESSTIKTSDFNNKEDFDTLEQMFLENYLILPLTVNHNSQYSRTKHKPVVVGVRFGARNTIGTHNLELCKLNISHAYVRAIVVNKKVIYYEPIEQNILFSYAMRVLLSNTKGFMQAYSAALDTAVFDLKAAQ